MQSFVKQMFTYLWLSLPLVTARHGMSRIMVTDDLEKNLGETLFACHTVVLLTKAGRDVTAKKGVPYPLLFGVL